MFIATTFFPVYDVTNFDINLNFFIKLFSQVPKKPGQKDSYDEIKRIFHHFKGLSFK